jgi:hypothetical protein
MVAAACGKLRSAIGASWRGKTVIVQRQTLVDGEKVKREVTVKLVDWCGSSDKTIDLYYAPMHQLGGTGVLIVAVSW